MAVEPPCLSRKERDPAAAAAAAAAVVCRILGIAQTGILLVVRTLDDKATWAVAGPIACILKEQP